MGGLSGPVGGMPGPPGVGGIPGTVGGIPGPSAIKRGLLSPRSSTSNPVQNIVLITLAFMVLSPLVDMVCDCDVVRGISRHLFCRILSLNPPRRSKKSPKSWGLLFLHLHRYSNIDASSGVSCVPSQPKAEPHPAGLTWQAFVFTVVPFYVPVFGKKLEKPVFSFARKLGPLVNTRQEHDVLLARTPEQSGSGPDPCAPALLCCAHDVVTTFREE